jgi:Amt family ammonium transporter
VGWFGFTDMRRHRQIRARRRELVAMVSAARWWPRLGRNDPGFATTGRSGLVAICAGSASCTRLARVGRSGRRATFVAMFTLTQNRWKIDDVLGRGCIPCGARAYRLWHLRSTRGGLGRYVGRVSAGTLIACGRAVGFVVYGVIAP